MSDIIDIEKKEEPSKEIKEVKYDLDKAGNYLLPNHRVLADVASLCIQQGMAPPHLAKEGRAAVGAALMMCKQHGLPQTAMSQMAYIKGRLTTFGSLYTALAQKHKDWRKMRVFKFDEECNKISVKNKNVKNKTYGVCIQILDIGEETFDEDRENYNEYTFTLDDADAAGLLNPTNRDGKPLKDSAWVKYIIDMLFHKAKARAFSREYASALEGVQMFEDVVESYQEMKDVQPRTRENESLNEFLEGLE